MIQRKVYCLKAGNMKNLKLKEEKLDAPSPGEVSVAENEELNQMLNLF